MRHIFKFAALLCLGGTLVFTSCENKDDTLPEAGSKMEFVTNPVAVNNTIDFLWYKVRGASSYNLQISTTSDFSSDIIDVQALETDHYTAENMEFDTPYYYRIRANFANGTTSAWVAPADPVICTVIGFQIMSYPVVNQKTGSDVTFKWVNYLKPGYIQITDSITGNVVRTVPLTDADRDAHTKTIQGLGRDSNYVATIFIADDYPDSSMAGQPMNSRSFFTFTPSPVTAAAYRLYYARVGWDPTYPITRIAVLDAAGNTIMEKTLSANELAAKEYTFPNQLALNADYTAVAYNDNYPAEYSWQRPFKSAGFATTITYNTDSDKLIAALKAPAYEGAEFFVAEGVSVKLSNFTFDKGGVTLRGQSPTNRSKVVVGATDTLKMVGNFNESLVFENIDFVQEEGVQKNNLLFGHTGRNATGGATANVVVRSVRFKNCTFQNFRSIFKLAGNTTGGTLTLDSLVFENCILAFNLSDTDANSGVIGRIDSGSKAVIKNLAILNSTVAGFCGHLWQRYTLNGGQKLTIINSTLYDFNNINDDFMRVQAGKVALFIANSIFGAAVLSTTQDTDFNPPLVYRGRTGNFRPMIGTFIPATNDPGNVKGGWNSYATGDYLLNGTARRIESNAYPGGANYELFLPNQLKKFDEDRNKVTSEALFNNPTTTVTTMDFGFKNPNYAALGVGDPRWLNGNPPAAVPEDTNKNPNYD